MSKVWALVYGEKKKIIGFNKSKDLVDAYKEGRTKEGFKEDYKIEEFLLRNIPRDILYEKSLMKFSDSVFSREEIKNAMNKHNEGLYNLHKSKETLEKIILNKNDINEVEVIKTTIYIIDKEILNMENRKVTISYI